MNIKKFLSVGGFGLAEVMLAAGLTGGIALTVAKLAQESNRINKSTETNYEINQFVSNVAFILSDKDNCVSTIPVNSPADNYAAPAISRNRSGVTEPVYKTDGTKYGNNTFSLASILTKKNPDDSVYLELTINRLSKVAYGTSQIKKKLPLKVVLDASKTQIQDCFSDTEAIISRAVEYACQGNTATWDPVTSTCTHQITTVSCAPGQVVTQVTLSGTEIVPICEDVNDFPRTCLPGEYVKSIDSKGTPTCEKLSAINSAGCPLGQYAFRLFDGNLECRSFPNCNPDQVVRSDASGNLSCQTIACGANQYFAGFDPGGAQICKVIPSRDCGAGSYVTRVNQDGSFDCGNLPPSAMGVAAANQYIRGYNAGTGAVIANTIPTCSGSSYLQFNGTSFICTPLPSTSDYMTKTELADIRPGTETPIHRSWLATPYYDYWLGWYRLGGDLAVGNISVCTTEKTVDTKVIPSVPYTRVLKVSAHVGIQTDDRDRADHFQAYLRTSSGAYIDYKTRLIWGEDSGRSWDSDIIHLEGYVTQGANTTLTLEARGKMLDGTCARFGQYVQFVVQEL
jgi:hypothetical protein